MAEVLVRIATEEDGPVLAELERRSPLALGDDKLIIDRGDDYFAAARLMEDATVLLAEVDGEPAGVLAGAVHPARVGGKERRMLYIHHARIPPEFQRLGLGRTLAARAQEEAKRVGFDSTYWYIAPDNARSQAFAAQAPNKWSFGPEMVELPARPSSAGGYRPATPADAAAITEILDAAHADEEMFLPYTVQRLRERLERAPKQYTWDHLWLADGAVVGAWPSGDHISTVLRSPDGAISRSRAATVLDYGCLPGRENQLRSLLEAVCGWAHGRGYQSVTIFTSAGARLRDLVLSRAESVSPFDFWTPAIPEPDDAARHGIYVDPVYF